MENTETKNKTILLSSLILLISISIVVFLVSNKQNTNSTSQKVIPSTSAPAAQSNNTNEEIQSLQNEINQLKNKNNLTQTTNQQIQNIPDLSAIVKQWSPVVSIVVCQFQNSNGTTYSGGSGTLFLYSDGTKRVLTNRHVVTDALGYGPVMCGIKFSNFHNDIIYIENNDVTVATNGSDFAYLNITNPNTYVKSITSDAGPNCQFTPELGDKVVILGYPVNGSQSDITISQGIISGYDGNYYITDAKIDHGNSGGAAIDLKKDCYLGTPNWVEGGSFESFGRILKWQVF